MTTETDTPKLTPDTESTLVFAGPTEPLTSTEIIAAETKNQHKNVLELVHKYLEDFQQFGLIAFETRFNTQGRQTEYANLNERQATLLISYMKNTDIIRAFKMRLVKEFYRMAQSQPTDPMDLMVQQAQAIRDQHRRTEALKAQQRALEAQQAHTEERLDQIETAEDHFTVMGYARHIQGIKALSRAEAQVMGKKVSRYCKDNGIATGSVPDGRFGTVKTYPLWVLKELFEG